MSQGLLYTFVHTYFQEQMYVIKKKTVSVCISFNKFVKKYNFNTRQQSTKYKKNK